MLTPQRPGQGDGLRHRPRGRRHLVHDDPDRGRHRHGAVPLARAGPRRDRSTPAPTCTRPAACCTNCSPAGRRSSASRRCRWPTSTSGRSRCRRRSFDPDIPPEIDADRPEGAGEEPRGALPERVGDAPGHPPGAGRPAGDRADGAGGSDVGDPGDGPDRRRGRRDPGVPAGRRRRPAAAGRRRPERRTAGRGATAASPTSCSAWRSSPSRSARTRCSPTSATTTRAAPRRPTRRRPRSPYRT